MRAFLVCSMILLLLIGAVLTNCLWVHHTVTELENTVLSMVSLSDSENQDRFTVAPIQATALATRWERLHPKIAIAVSEEELLPIAQTVTQLEAYATVGCVEEYEMCRAQLLSNLKRLKELEMPHWHTLL